MPKVDNEQFITHDKPTYIVINDLDLISCNGHFLIIYVPHYDIAISFSPFALQKLLELAKKHHFLQPTPSN